MKKFNNIHVQYDEQFDIFYVKCFRNEFLGLVKKFKTLWGAERFAKKIYEEV